MVRKLTLHALSQTTSFPLASNHDFREICFSTLHFLTHCGKGVGAYTSYTGSQWCSDVKCCLKDISEELAVMMTRLKDVTEALAMMMTTRLEWEEDRDSSQMGLALSISHSLAFLLSLMSFSVLTPPPTK
jgi:hypothetical protein